MDRLFFLPPPNADGRTTAVKVVVEAACFEWGGEENEQTPMLLDTYVRAGRASP